MLKSGDGHAFTRLIGEYKDRIYNSCLGIVQSQADAEDITQEVFIEIWRSVGKFRGDSSLSTWIYRMAVNKSIDHLRKRKRKKQGWVISIFGWGDNELQVKDPADFFHPGVAMERRESASLLFAAIDKLPEKQKAAFVLQNLENLDMKSIAGILDTSPAAVESLLSRARSNLRKMLGDYYDEKTRK